MAIMQRICKQCEISFRGGPRAYYCPSCRYIRTRERDIIRKRNGALRPLGSIDKCKMCCKEYVVVSGLQEYCPDCQKPHAKEYDRETSIDFYHKNKQRINPVRYPKRQKPPIKCRWCSKEFKPHTRSKECSPECKRAYLNKYARDLRQKKRTSPQGLT